MWLLGVRMPFPESTWRVGPCLEAVGSTTEALAPDRAVQTANTPFPVCQATFLGAENSSERRATS